MKIMCGRVRPGMAAMIWSEGTNYSATDGPTIINLTQLSLVSSITSDTKVLIAIAS